MLTLDKIYKASHVLRSVIRKTDLIHAPLVNPDSEIYLKTENLQITGSFKVRGAYYMMSQLTEEEKARGVIACSAGNHAQGVALAAAKNHIKSLICLPDGAPISKVEATKSYGAEVCMVNGVYDDAYKKALELKEEKNYTFVHPFDNEDVIAGQGTIGLEILEQMPDVEAVIVPIGGGGLCTGVSTLAKLLNPNIKVIGVEPAGANCMQASLKAGHVLTLPTVNTIADGTAVKRPGEKLFPYIQKYVDDIITVEDSELIVAFLDIVENHKMVVENSGLLTVAALKHLNVKKKKIVSILSGGNMDVITMSSVVQHGLIQRDRIFTVSVLLPDKPGELAKVATLLASERGNVIKLEHNQFVSINRNAAVELRITLEAEGTEHKNKIVQALSDAGYRPKLVKSKGSCYNE